MLNKLKQSKEQGFTIIEVMIVLAIAGLIMVVVFMAVPALQRNGRNNALDTSANNVMTSVGEYVSNNGGSLPAAAAAATPASGAVTIGASGNTTKANVDAGVKSVAIIDTTGTQITNTGDVGVIQVVKGAKCNSTNTAADTANVSTRSYAVLYVAESGSGKILKCVGA